MNKKNLNIIKKIFAAVIAVTLTLTAFVSDDIYNISADTVKELEAKQAALEKEKNDIEEELKKYEGEVEKTEKYLEDYDKKMHIQEDQIAVVEEQIELCQNDIDELNLRIADTNVEIEEGIELFGQRLRAMYISGNDGITGVLAGSSDFYDMLVRIELYERISKRDSEIIENLKEKIIIFETDKLSLEEKMSALELKKSEEKELYEELRETYNNHSEMKAMQKAMLDDYAARADEIEEENEEIEQLIQAEIRRQQEEAERKRKEREAQLQKEEDERKKAAEASGEEYVPQSTTVFTSYSETGFIWPVPSVRNYTDVYGSRWIVEESRNDFHKGLDITAPGCYGKEIVASAAGEVLTAANTGNGYGNHVVIDHGNKVSTLYGHCSSLAVKAGDIVEQGQVIGYIGATGYAYGNHLHFEVRVNGEHTDPFNYVSP
mgnify:CR=1 FL=1